MSSDARSPCKAAPPRPALVLRRVVAQRQVGAVDPRRRPRSVGSSTGRAVRRRDPPGQREAVGQTVRRPAAASRPASAPASAPTAATDRARPTASRRPATSSRTSSPKKSAYSGRNSGAGLPPSVAVKVPVTPASSRQRHLARQPVHPVGRQADIGGEIVDRSPDPAPSVPSPARPAGPAWSRAIPPAPSRASRFSTRSRLALA